MNNIIANMILVVMYFIVIGIVIYFLGKMNGFDDGWKGHGKFIKKQEDGE